MQPDRIADNYQHWLSTIWTAKTVKVRGTFARKRLQEWGLDGFTPEKIQGYLAPTGSLQPWSRATYYAHLKDLCAYLVAAGHLEADPMEHVVKPKRPNGVPRSLSPVEEARITSAATGDIRDWIDLALLQGLRAHEIAKIRGDDVTPEYLYLIGKGGVLAALPTHPDVWEMAQRHDEAGYWFPGGDNGHISGNTISIQVGKFFRDHGIPKGSIHRCRHTYATRLLRQGNNIRTVQKLMRHASLQSTQVYTDVTDDELRNAILGLRAEAPANGRG